MLLTVQFNDFFGNFLLLFENVETNVVAVYRCWYAFVIQAFWIFSL